MDPQLPPSQGRHQGAHRSNGRLLLLTLAVGAIVLAGVWLVSHLIWDHTPDVLVILSIPLIAALATVLDRRLRNKS